MEEIILSQVSQVKSGIRVSYHISTSETAWSLSRLVEPLLLVVVFFPPVSLGSWSTFLKNSFWPRYSDSWKLNICPSTMLKADTSYLEIFGRNVETAKDICHKDAAKGKKCP